MEHDLCMENYNLFIPTRFKILARYRKNYMRFVSVDPAFGPRAIYPHKLLEPKLCPEVYYWILCDIEDLERNVPLSNWRVVESMTMQCLEGLMCIIKMSVETHVASMLMSLCGETSLRNKVHTTSTQVRGAQEQHPTQRRGRRAGGFERLSDHKMEAVDILRWWAFERNYLWKAVCAVTMLT